MNARTCTWVLVGVLAGCGGSSSSPAPTPTPSPTPTVGGPQAFQLTISGLAFSPLDLQVPAGATVTVVNRDAMPHSVTSEASPGAFTPGAVGGVQFDTGPFTGTRTFTIPANAATGTVIPYYCTVHLGTMATPNGTITIVAASPPAPTPTPTPTPTVTSMPGGGY